VEKKSFRFEDAAEITKMTFAKLLIEESLA
jgi:hypothetical protein